ncbi:LURP-one-related/scramblase family protein [Carnobacterium mobile]|uniref:LURP-one-related/scramblase family protein n=1 Tax=Carnobacterium mobile TaxID=2750 RepID=UPI0018683D13|nr:LURP-one-related family protein [Carnobacterium mobile]
MVHLYMKQAYVSLQNRIIVKDEAGKDIFLIIGKWGRIGDGLSLYAMDGTLLVEVKQTVLSVFPKFNIYVAGDKVASISKQPGIKGPYFKVNQLNWIVKGDFYNHHYTVQHRLQTIMQMEKAYLPFGDFYALSITHSQDIPICLCIAVIVDHLTLTRLPAKAKRKSYLPI